MTAACAQVIDTLMATWSAAPALAGVRIIDGPPLADFEDPDVIAVGLAVEDVAAALADTRPGWGDDFTETFDLTCLAQSWSGDVDLAARRARAFDLFTACRLVVDQDRQLGGVCDFARVVRWIYRPVQDPSGSLALIEFAVRVDATRFAGG